jgi:glycosyltransferase involved in cell wall biosynthesis
MKRILAAIVVPPHLSVSGAVRAAEQLSDVLAADCDMTVASMMNGAAAEPPLAGPGRVRRIAVKTWKPPMVPWSRLPNRYSTLFYRSDLPALVAGGGYDLVHLHNPMPGLELERTAKACLAAGVPYVISTHGFNEIANGARIYGFDLVRSLAWRQLAAAPVARVVRQAAAVFALSPADFGIVRSMGYSGEISVVGNGVPMPAAADEAADRMLLARLGIPAMRSPGQISCMFLANHTPNKGLPDLLAAFSQLECPYLLMVGGERRSGIDYDRHIRACRPGQQIVITGRLTDEEVAALFRRSDVFVFPTLADTFPLVVLEAMSHGVPVLASRVGGIPHQLGDHCGILVPPGDAGSLAAALTALAREPGQLARMGNLARARVAAEFSWKHAAEQALMGYERVLGARQLPTNPTISVAEPANAD